MVQRDETNRRGIAIANDAFEAIGFAFREQTTSDFGIDAHLEPRVGNRGTGSLIGLQVKSGASYFSAPSREGWSFKTDVQHANYWLSHSLPVVVVLVDVEAKRVFWEAVTKQTVSFTNAGAKIFIRKNQEISRASMPKLRALLFPFCDLGLPAAEGADCRVFLGRGVSGRDEWIHFAKVLVRQFDEIACLAAWDIVVEVRTGAEDDHLSAVNEYGDDGADLAYISVDADRRLATYSLSLRIVDQMVVDLTGEEGDDAEAHADAVIQHLMAEEKLLDEDERDEG